MNIKVNGTNPVNVELDGIPCHLFNYKDMRSILHFTLSVEQALELRKKLINVLKDRPITAFENTATPAVRKEIQVVRSLPTAKIPPKQKEWWKDDSFEVGDSW